jgi:hypothetical protein
MIYLSVVCCGRAVPLLWRVLEHGSATVAFKVYQLLLRKARWLLRQDGESSQPTPSQSMSALSSMKC